MMSYLESKYYANPDYLLFVDELDGQHGEYQPAEVGYAYKLGRGKDQTVKSVLHTGTYEKQLLFESSSVEFWPYPGTDPRMLEKRAKMRQPDVNSDPDFLLTLPQLVEMGRDRRSHEIIRKNLMIEVGRAYKMGRGKNQIIKAFLEPGLHEKDLLWDAGRVELKPFVRVLPESLGEPTPVEAPTYRLHAALTR